MKAYTDIEQSKILAKILPIVSSDMWYSRHGHPGYNSVIAHNGEQWFLCQIRNSLHDIPCWSLAALLNVLCSNANDVRMGGTAWYWWCKPLFSDSAKYIKNTGGNELVDVCCEIIFKLKEENLL